MVKVTNQVYSLTNRGSEGLRVYAPGLDGEIVKEKTETMNYSSNMMKDQGREF